MDKVKLILSHSTCVDSIYPHLSVKDILNLQLVCSAIHFAVQNWIPGAYNVNNHFRRFFDDPLSFRVLQARTGALVSGSDALQFFDRTYYPDSDLDIYVPCRYTSTVSRWLQENDYNLVPSAKQQVLIQMTSTEALLEEVSSRRFSSRRRGELPDTDYGWSCIEEVFTFVHQGKAHLKVQLIVVDPHSSPVACVLHFHSTLVMNFIAWDKAYSLFPSATFLDRVALTFGDVARDPSLVPIYAKYSLRGYKITAIPLEATLYSKLFAFGTRWVNDKHSWVIDLPTEDITPVLEGTYYGEPIRHHAGFTLADNYISWYGAVKRNPDRFPYNAGAPAIYFENLRSTVLKNVMILPMVERSSWNRVKMFLDAQERFQYQQARALNPVVDLGLNESQIEGWKLISDLDPIESHGVAAIQQYYWELPYWSSERHRNSFRRVSSSWNQYLRKFSHRYIRMTDIIHAAVPKTAFPHAIRFYLDLCECEICIGFDVISMESAERSRDELLRDLVNTHGPPSGLKIIHGDECNENEIARMLGPKKLHSILASNISLAAGIERADLRVLICRRDGDYYSVDKSAPPLQFPSLTTLSIEVEDFTVFTGLRLDALKHLSVSCVKTAQDSLIRMLTMLGSQLETFFWEHELSNQTMPGEIWSICPKLIQIQTPYKWEREPPLNHPICCVRLSFGGIVDRDLPNQPKDFREHLPVSTDGRFEERGVMLAHHWPQLLFPPNKYWSIHLLWEAVDIAADIGVNFVDLDGLYLEEYVLKFLLHVWRRVTVRRTYRDMEIDGAPLEF